jgi:DNA invertase Pin-like site-specific DNA recombinase
MLSRETELVLSDIQRMIFDNPDPTDRVRQCDDLHRYWTETRNAVVWRMREEGIGTTAIARLFDVHERTVRRWFETHRQENGLPYRGVFVQPDDLANALRLPGT